MKHTVTGRIVGHELFTPDPKKPAIEMVKVKLNLDAVTDEKISRCSKAVLLVDEEAAADFPLGGTVRISVQDEQQVLPLDGDRRRSSKRTPQSENTH